MRRLYVDIDSCIWNAEDWYDEACMELYGEPFSLSRGVYQTSEQLREEYGEDYHRIFDIALDPSRVKDRILYPGVDAALAYIHELGLAITFISHNHRPAPLRDAVREWLEEQLSLPFGLTIYGARNDKVHTMIADPGAWGLVEDKPSTLRKSAERGFATFAKLQSWNRDLTLDPDCGIMGFDEWDELPELVEKELKWSRSAL